jgi:regulator of protease activity HflC (stomatin/prohibitin superfamily)
MPFFIIFIVLVLVLMGLRIVQQYQTGVVFRFGRIIGVRSAGLNLIIRKVDLRTVTLPVQPQKIITKDNVSVDVSVVAYYKVVDPVKSIVAIENVMNAINQIAQTTVRNIVGRFQLDEILSERDAINNEIRNVLDGHTEPWGVVVSVVEIKDIELPEKSYWHPKNWPRPQTLWLLIQLHYNLGICRLWLRFQSRKIPLSYSQPNS